MSDKKPVIFISYSHKDEPERPASDEVAWLTFVQSFLAPVVKVGIFDIWVDEHLHGGEVLDPEIKKKLADCDILVLLASRYSLASTYVVETEIATIRQRQKDGGDVHIFPVLLSPIPNAALKQLKDLVLRPKDGKPFSTMSRSNRESAMSSIADEIAMLAEEIAKRKVAASKPVASETKSSPGLAAIAGRNDRTAEQLVDISHLPETAYERLVGREAEMKRLDEAWVDSNTNIISLIAEGGAGKSALVNEWLKRLEVENFHSAEAVLGWSFYSQGTKERATSAEQFLNWALDKLGIQIETTSASAKGEAIAESLAKHRVLLVLDGCEPLQHGLDKQQGDLKDQGLRALLRRFAAIPPAHTHGLIVLTSRLSVKDIARWEGDTTSVVDVEKLSEVAGAALLRDNGVWGTDKQLQATVRDFGGHPLAIALLASLLKETQLGDVRRRDHVRALLHDADDRRHAHARRVMASYETEWLAGRPILLAIMYMIGLFDRPASRDCLQALRKEPAILGFTDALVGLEEGEWQRSVARLRDVRLLAPKDPIAPDALDAHPLVREWFGDRLNQKDKAAWQAANGRIYEHLRDTTKESEAPTLEDLAPLYQAIAHGCRAGRHQEALDDIYTERICRRLPNGQIEFYTKRKLGAFGSDLAAISWFFETPYEKPISTLSPADQSWLLAEAAIHLHAQGRFAEGLPAYRIALRMGEEANDWANAAVRAYNLCEAELLVGQVATAVSIAEKSVSHAHRSGSELQILARLTMHANTLQAFGQHDKARALFADAERRQKRLQPKLSFLYSVRGYHYCDFFLDEGNHSVAHRRAMKILGWEIDSTPLLDRALARLAVGRANLGLALEHIGGLRRNRTIGDQVYIARARIYEGVEGLRATGISHHIPRGLRAGASFHRSVGNWDGAARDLDEVEEIAELGPMKLYLCDMALERARLAFAQIESFAPLIGLIDDSSPKPALLNALETRNLKEEAAKQLAIAADYIKTCGYHRRDEELAELEAVLRRDRKFADLPPRV